MSLTFKLIYVSICFSLVGDCARNELRLQERNVTLASTPNEFLCQPPKYLLGESFIGFLASFESFCESAEAPDAAKRPAFLASLPETMKFEMQEADKQLYELSYDVLKQKATAVGCGAKQSNKARQQLKSRCQAIGESSQSYVAALPSGGRECIPR